MNKSIKFLLRNVVFACIVFLALNYSITLANGLERTKSDQVVETSISPTNHVLAKREDKAANDEEDAAAAAAGIKQPSVVKIDKSRIVGGGVSDTKSGSEEEAEAEKHMKSIKANVGFIHAFFASLSVIVVSEIGDKTFFIAAIMAMKHSRFTIYSGAMLALGLMTLLSALLGNILTKVIPRAYTYYASSILFALFGLKMLKEGCQMSHADATEEYEEAQHTLKESEEKNANMNGKDLELGQAGSGSSSDSNSSGGSMSRRFTIFFRQYFSAILLQAFVLTFLAEWGDRSQISTIILGARENMVGTVLGGTLGHGICTGLAVIGGRIIAQRISVRTVTLVGAVVFLFFAFSAFFIDPESY